MLLIAVAILLIAVGAAFVVSRTSRTPTQFALSWQDTLPKAWAGELLFNASTSEQPAPWVPQALSSDQYKKLLSGSAVPLSVSGLFFPPLADTGGVETPDLPLASAHAGPFLVELRPSDSLPWQIILYAPDIMEIDGADQSQPLQLSSIKNKAGAELLNAAYEDEFFWFESPASVTIPSGTSTAVYVAGNDGLSVKDDLPSTAPRDLAPQTVAGTVDFVAPVGIQCATFPVSDALKEPMTISLPDEATVTLSAKNDDQEEFGPGSDIAYEYSGSAAFLYVFLRTTSQYPEPYKYAVVELGGGDTKDAATGSQSLGDDGGEPTEAAVCYAAQSFEQKFPFALEKGIFAK